MSNRYLRSKTDSVLYCPYCGRTFRMTYERYRASYEAYRRHEQYALTDCKACKKKFWFWNITPEKVRTGFKAVMKYEERS